MAIEQTRELEQFMQDGFDKQADRMYLIPHEPPVFYVQGALDRGTGAPLTAGQVRDIAAAAFGAEELASIGTETGQLTTLCTLPGVVDVRLCATKAGGQYALTLYFQPAAIPTPACARIPEAILKAAGHSRGLVLFSGPTGSGKTTSLLVTLEEINRTRACHIGMVEHIPAWRLTPKQAIIQQREVGVDVPSMREGISTCILQGADVVMVGELRETEEIRLCLMAAQNLLVLTQLHADTPEGAIQRMVEVFPDDSAAVPRRILAEKLRGACAQRLLDRADGKGRVAAYGVMIPDEPMRRAIAEGGDIFDRKTPLPGGCRTLAEDIQHLYEDGVITEQTRDDAMAELAH